VPFSVDFSTWVALRERRYRSSSIRATKRDDRARQASCGGIGDVEVERLRLVDPFLAARRRLDQPHAVDLEGGGIEGFEVAGMRSIEPMLPSKYSDH